MISVLPGRGGNQIISSMTLFWRVSVVIVSAFLLPPPAGTKSPERSFNFPSFPLGSCLNGGPLIYMQNSSLRPGGYLALIPEPEDGMDPNLLENNVGRVLYSSPAISRRASFDTNFTVLIKKNPNASGFGDGMAFVMTNDKRPSPKGSIGGLLGLFGPSTKGNTTGQLAVEIDTFSNEYDQDGDFHVGLDISTIFNNDSAPLSVANVDLAKQKPITYRIRYDGWSKQLEIMAGYADDSPLKSVHNWSVVIASINVTYVGFSAASGPSDDYSESIRVLSWYFSYTPLPEDSLASPAGGKSKQGVKRKVAIALAVLFASCFLGLVVFLGVKRFMKWRRRRWL
ncbi:lectin-like [Wolffia australiana]